MLYCSNVKMEKGAEGRDREGEEAGEGKREDEGGGADGHAARGQADPQAGGLNSSVQTVPLT